MGCCSSTDKPSSASGEHHRDDDTTGSDRSSLRGNFYVKGCRHHQGRRQNREEEDVEFADVVSSSADSNDTHPSNDGARRRPSSSSSSGAYAASVAIAAVGNTTNPTTKPPTQMGAGSLFEIMRPHAPDHSEGSSDSPTAVTRTDVQITLPVAKVFTTADGERVDFNKRSTGRRFDGGGSIRSFPSPRHHTLPPVPTAAVGDLDLGFTRSNISSHSAGCETFAPWRSETDDVEDDAEVNLRDIHHSRRDGAGAGVTNRRSKYGPRVGRPAQELGVSLSLSTSSRTLENHHPHAAPSSS